MSKIKVAILGIGGCANAILQAIEWYREDPDRQQAGLAHVEIGGYKVTDIVPVAAFDVDERKVGRDLSEAIFAAPNLVDKFADVPHLGVEVMMGPAMDGVDEHLAQMVKVSDRKPVDVVAVLREAKPDLVLNFLPTGGIEASKYYAECAMEGAGAGFINGMPALIANDEKFVKMSERCNVPLIGDDVKSQVGGTALCRYLLQLFLDKGVRPENMYQLNSGGNADFFNMRSAERRASKEKTKRSGMQSLVPHEIGLGGPMGDYIPFLGDNKVAHTYLEGVGFGGRPVTIHAILQVWDSPNFGGVMVEAVRCAKLAMDRGVGGLLTSVSAFMTKYPPEKMSEGEAKVRMDEFIAGKRER
jgi:myo-inositol-1-phosphate synthase